MSFHPGARSKSTSKTTKSSKGSSKTSATAAFKPPITSPLKDKKRRSFGATSQEQDDGNDSKKRGYQRFANLTSGRPASPDKKKGSRQRSKSRAKAIKVDPDAKSNLDRIKEYATKNNAREAEKEAARQAKEARLKAQRDSLHLLE